MSTEKLLMPPHDLDDDAVCRSSMVPGYVHQNPDGTLHCNRCGWVTPEPVVTAHSERTGNTYLTWDELVAAESNGYVVVGLSDRPGTYPGVIGPFATKPEAMRAKARCRRKWAKDEELRGYKLHTSVRILWPDAN
jgi:hypothetical protein